MAAQRVSKKLEVRTAGKKDLSRPQSLTRAAAYILFQVIRIQIFFLLLFFFSTHQQIYQQICFTTQCWNQIFFNYVSYEVFVWGVCLLLLEIWVCTAGSDFAHSRSYFNIFLWKNIMAWMIDIMSELKTAPIGIMLKLNNWFHCVCVCASKIGRVLQKQNKSQRRSPKANA